MSKTSISCFHNAMSRDMTAWCFEGPPLAALVPLRGSVNSNYMLAKIIKLENNTNLDMVDLFRHLIFPAFHLESGSSRRRDFRQFGQRSKG